MDPGLPRLRRQREPDLDLKLQLQSELSSLTSHCAWVKAHQDQQPWHTIQDLRDLNLSRDATYNSWCDKIAMDTRQSTYSDPSPKVLPAERWAVYVNYPIPHKATRDFNESIYTCLSYPQLATYLQTKHDLSSYHLDQVNCLDLRGFLKSLTPHTRATYVKFIQRWIPTHSFLFKQGREFTNRCPLCHTSEETLQHIFPCQNPQTRTNRLDAFTAYLRTLSSIHTPSTIIQAVANHLATILQINSVSYPCPQQLPNPLSMQDAIKHQNIMGWDMFLRGFISQFWIKAYASFTNLESAQTPRQWSKKFLSSTLTFAHSMWTYRNQTLHGEPRKEHEELLFKYSSILRLPSQELIETNN